MDSQNRVWCEGESGLLISSDVEVE